MDWRALVPATLALYGGVLEKTPKRLAAAWWVALLPLGYTLFLNVAAGILGSLGLAGSLLVGLLATLCISSYLYFIDAAVHGRRIRPGEVFDSWRTYFGAVLTLLFLLMIVRLLVGMLPPGTAGTHTVAVVVFFGLPILISPTPEIICRGRAEGLGLVQESLEFLRESGVEWFLPLTGLAVFCAGTLQFPLLGVAASIFFPLDILATPMQFGGPGMLLWPGVETSPAALAWAVGSCGLVYALMVFRGLLFEALAGGTRRQRIFRARAA